MLGSTGVLEASSSSLWLGQVFCIALPQLVDFDSVVGGRELSMVVPEESNLKGYKLEKVGNLVFLEWGGLIEVYLGIAVLVKSFKGDK